MFLNASLIQTIAIIVYWGSDRQILPVRHTSAIFEVLGKLHIAALIRKEQDNDVTVFFFEGLVLVLTF